MRARPLKFLQPCSKTQTQFAAGEPRCWRKLAPGHIAQVDKALMRELYLAAVAAAEASANTEVGSLGVVTLGRLHWHSQLLRRQTTGWAAADRGGQEAVGP